MIGKIRQARVSTTMYVFKENFLNKYNFVNYFSKTEPAIFFGCYKNYERDCKAIIDHKGFAVVLWGGSDIQHLHKKPRMLTALKRRRNTWHIAMSDYIAWDLKKLGFNYKQIPICPTIHGKFKPKPLGPNVYVYGSHTRGYDYGMDILKKIMKKAPDLLFIIGYSTAPGHIPYNSMPGVYEQCFCGLRLTRHDGLSNTVVELGLMGRRCLWNGGSPNGIKWSEKDIDAIVEILYAERERVGRIDNYIATMTREWLTVGEDWKRVSFYA